MTTKENYGQIRTSEIYLTTLNSFKRFRMNVDVTLEEIDAELLLSYEYYLKVEGVTPNTISFYMNRLRATYNRAVEQEQLEQRFPFKRVKTSIEKTVKRAIVNIYTASDDSKYLLSIIADSQKDHRRQTIFFFF